MEYLDSWQSGFRCVWDSNCTGHSHGWPLIRLQWRWCGHISPSRLFNGLQYYWPQYSFRELARAESWIHIATVQNTYLQYGGLHSQFLLEKYSRKGFCSFAWCTSCGLTKNIHSVGIFLLMYSNSLYMRLPLKNTQKSHLLQNIAHVFSSLV